MPLATVSSCTHTLSYQVDRAELHCATIKCCWQEFAGLGLFGMMLASGGCLLQLHSRCKSHYAVHVTGVDMLMSCVCSWRLLFAEPLFLAVCRCLECRCVVQSDVDCQRVDHTP